MMFFNFVLSNQPPRTFPLEWGPSSPKPRILVPSHMLMVPGSGLRAFLSVARLAGLAASREGDPGFPSFQTRLSAL